MSKTIPAIRIRGFTDEWEQRKLIDVCDYVDYRGKTPVKTDDGVFLVTAKNVKAGYIDYQTSQEYIAEEDYDEVMHRGLPKMGDVLITTEAPCGNVAQVDREDIALAQRIIKYRGHKNVIDNTYLKHYLLTPFFQEILASKSSGGTVQGIKGSILHQQAVIHPKYDEQVKIGKCLDNLDRLITLYQRKYNSLKQVKKYMLQKMFPKQGEKVPEIRFAGFTGEWEKRKLGEVSDKVTQKNQNAVINEVFTNSAEFGIISQRDFFDKDIANAENIEGYYVVEPDDFVYNPRISTTAPFGPIKRNKLGRTGAMSPLYYVFRLHDIDLSYLEWFFQTTCWHAFMRINGNSGARADRFAITDGVFAGMPICIPSDIDEQRKIGSYFSNLDNIITLYQRKVDSLKQVKKYMLQNMFPK
ncbi:MAG: restriction endonuclease subunit S [Anaerovibrio sp.]|nr:restriction endonuclease subunit S [Anaerovibrio sp.]